MRRDLKESGCWERKGRQSKGEGNLKEVEKQRSCRETAVCA